MNGIMAVSEENLDEFIDIYERTEGDHLPREEAREVANNLVNLYRIIMQPPPHEQVQNADEAPSSSRAICAHRIDGSRRTG